MRTVPDFPAADYDRWKTTPPDECDVDDADEAADEADDFDDSDEVDQ